MLVNFVHTPDNPAPPGAQLYAVTTKDGLSLRAASWEPKPGPCLGTVILIQGRSEFIEKYFEVIGELLDRQLAVVTFDWRSQGGSEQPATDRHRGHVMSFDAFRLDYEAVRASVRPRGPVIVLAHSMGGCVALTAAAEGWLDADRLVLSSPMLDLSLVSRPRLVRVLSAVLVRLGLGGFMVPGGSVGSISRLPFEGNRLCRDRRRYQRNAAIATALEAGAIGSPTIGWVRAAYQAMDRLAAPAVGRAISVPTLIVAAGDDPVCATAATEAFAAMLGQGTLIVVPESRHEVLMETDELRARFWEAFDRFLSDLAHSRAREAAPA